MFYPFLSTPGHETVGTIVALGPQAKTYNNFSLDDRVVADNSEPCMSCFHCRRDELLFCEHLELHGITLPGGFAEYAAYPAHRIFKISPNLSDEEATLIEPASCAAHGIDRIDLRMGSEVLMFGAGPTGLVLAQMLRRNGASRLVLAAPGGLKMDLARQLDVADEYVELSRTDPAPQYERLKRQNPYGFDVVVEATGAVQVLQDSMSYVRRGGKLVVYGVYKDKDSVQWPPNRICTSAFAPFVCCFNLHSSRS